MLGSGAPSPFAAGHISITLPVLAETERRRAWQRALSEGHVAVDDVDTLAARYRIGPGVIRRAIAAAHDARVPAPTSPTPLPAAAIEAYIRQTRETRLAQIATRVCLMN